MGQLKAIVRRIYSNPPMHGCQVTATVLNDPELHALWVEEVEGMRKRIARVRRETHEQLAAKLPGYDSRYFVAQQGMFSYNGLSSDQLRPLREQHGVYIIVSGHISVPGLHSLTIMIG